MTLVIGYCLSGKAKTFREYAVGNKQFSTPTLVATLLAALFGGGSLMRNVTQIYELGLYWIIPCFFGKIEIWRISILASRMGPFIKNLSMAETIGMVYGRYPRIIIALCSICTSILAITTQINVMSMVLRICIDSINPKCIIIFVTLILIAYSAFGGIRAVTFTDLFQVVTFTVIIPLIAWFMFLKTEKTLSEVIDFLHTQEKFEATSVFHCDMKLVNMFSILLAYITNIGPLSIQRIYMCASPIQAKNVFLYTALFCPFIIVFIIAIGIFVFVGVPELPQEFLQTAIWDYITSNVPPMFKGLIVITCLAMSMSTTDSYLNLSVIMIVHDLLESIQGKRNLSYINKIIVAKIATIVVGLFAMGLAFFKTDLGELLLLYIDISSATIATPFILALFGFRSSSHTALVGMATGVLTIYAWNKWVEPTISINGAFVAMVANGVAMIVTHYLRSRPKDSYR